MLNNLVSNAIKFTQSGTIAVAVMRDPEQGAVDASVILRFNVQDTGIGIDAAMQDELFQPFVQADTSITRQFGGTGLGLTICRRIVQTMGGEIGVESELGQGSTFWFRVPLRIADGTTEIPPTPETIILPRPLAPVVSKSAIRILIVEDYDDNRDILLVLLEEMGYKADCVTNGQEFLDRIAEQDYDIILMDCQMPILDGYEATRRLRQREAGEKHAIVIGLTAHAMEGDRQKCLDAGMDDYISKPIEAEMFSTLLLSWAPLAANDENSESNGENSDAP